jgi:penicillin-binding protein 1C
LGGLLLTTPGEFCHEKKTAWLLNRTVPKTLPDENALHWQSNPLTFQVNAENGKPVNISCQKNQSRKKTVALWPLAVEPWLPELLTRHVQIGTTAKDCPAPALYQGKLQIEGLHDQARLRAAGADKNLPIIKLLAHGGQGKLYWFINGNIRYSANHHQAVKHQFSKPGLFQIAVTDEAGNTAAVEARVLPSQN